MMRNNTAVMSFKSLDGIPSFIAIDRENYRVYTLEDMLPQGFGPANLE
jgi:cytidine deaminase